MRIRAASNHAICQTCVRHRALIKGLGGHLKARKCQQEYLLQHLRDQYADRLAYYQARAISRLTHSGTVTIIQDGMDQNKMSLPRHACLAGKDFSTFVKPKCHVSMSLVHGWFTMFAISNPDCMKDSNASIESLAHALHLLSTKHSVNLRHTHVNIQGDNTPRELKNNMTIRWLASQVSAGNLRSGSLKFLRCGHSHEDVDQCFGRLARALCKARDVQTPDGFMCKVEAFSSTFYRPFEPARYTVKMDATRDWRLGPL